MHTFLLKKMHIFLVLIFQIRSKKIKSVPQTIVSSKFFPSFGPPPQTK